MITFNEAKEIALNNVDGEVYQINCARETDDAYLFDNMENAYDSHVPFVITKSDGVVYNHFTYAMQYNVDWTDWRPIDFETGLPCAEWDGRDDDSEEEEE